MSIQWTITTAVEDVLAAMAGFGMPGVTMFKVQKRPFFSADHGHTLPFVAICPMKERILEQTMANRIVTGYPVVVAILQAFGSTWENETQLQWQLDRREEVWLALWKNSLAGATTVFNTDYEPDPVFDLQGLDRHHDVSLQLFLFHSNQARSA